MWGLFWKGCLLIRGSSIISVQRKNYGSKVFPKNGQFWSTCPKEPIKVILTYRNHRVCVWLMKKVFWKAWNCSKSWCIPNYQISNLIKNHHLLCCLIIEEFEKKSFQVRDFMASCLNRQDQKIHLIFKSVPLACQGFLFKWFQSGGSV